MGYRRFGEVGKAEGEALGNARGHFRPRAKKNLYIKAETHGFCLTFAARWLRPRPPKTAQFKFVPM